MSPESANQKLATHLLGEPVLTWVANRRADGQPYRLIARTLYELTEGQIDVTPEAIRQWTLETVA
jgi:hypothetical protein